MKRISLLVVACTALVVAVPSHAVTGNEYRALSETSRQAWVAGTIDGILTAQLVLAQKQPALAKCLSQLVVAQQRAIFEKALEADPERWHFPAAFKLLTTFNEYCGVK
jgi:hypothetical protein